MNKNIGWFSLIELTISIFVMIIIIIWLSYTIVWISEDFKKNQMQINTYQDVKDFLFDSYSLSYSTGLLLKNTNKYDTAVLYNSKWWILLWVFDDNELWYDYKLNNDKTIYKFSNLWYFKFWTWVLKTILDDTWSIYDLKFNDWKIYKNLIINDFIINSYNTWSIYEANLSIIPDLKPNFIWELKQNLQIDFREIIKLNFNF